MGIDSNLIAVLQLAFPALGFISIVLYGLYWARDYLGDPERPPHYIPCTLGLILSLSIAFPGWIGTVSVHVSDFKFSEVLDMFLRIWIGGVVGLVIDVVSRHLRQRRQTQRQRREWKALGLVAASEVGHPGLRQRVARGGLIEAVDEPGGDWQLYLRWRWRGSAGSGRGAPEGNAAPATGAGAGPVGRPERAATDRVAVRPGSGCMPARRPTASHVWYPCWAPARSRQRCWRLV
jgi:hypothetical protein